jgi:hypothetical protein
MGVSTWWGRNPATVVGAGVVPRSALPRIARLPDDPVAVGPRSRHALDVRLRGLRAHLLQAVFGGRQAGGPFDVVQARHAEQAGVLDREGARGGVAVQGEMLVPGPARRGNEVDG